MNSHVLPTGQASGLEGKLQSLCEALLDAAFATQTKLKAHGAIPERLRSRALG